MAFGEQGCLPPTTSVGLAWGPSFWWCPIRTAKPEVDFPELRNFPSGFAAVSGNRGIPLRFRFFCELPQGFPGAYRNLILKVEL
jgi:hypothetical protein